jgi:predicted nuclease of predicted toxin-antitoxin system
VRIKVDENLGRRCVDVLRSAGHDATTVPEQGLCSASDEHVVGVCCAERRVLVTLDLDFANPLVFRPSSYSGIAVLRLPRRATADDIAHATRTLVGGLAARDIAGRLWVVRGGRIREYDEESVT